MEIAAGRYALVTDGLMKGEIVKILPDKSGEIALLKESLKVLG